MKEIIFLYVVRTYVYYDTLCLHHMYSKPPQDHLNAYMVVPPCTARAGPASACRLPS